MIQPLLTLGIACCAAAAFVVRQPSEKAEKPPSAHAREPDAGAETFLRLERVAERYSETKARLNNAAKRADGLRLSVDWGWAWGAGDLEWPEDFAPREEFIKLAERAIDELRSSGVLREFALIAEETKIVYPRRAPDGGDRLKLAPIREMFRLHGILAARAIEAGNRAEAAAHLGTNLRIAKLLSDGLNVEVLIGHSELAGGVKQAMAAVVDGKFTASERKELRDALRFELRSRADLMDRHVENVVQLVDEVWPRLPAALFKDGADAQAAWDSLPEPLRAQVTGAMANASFLSDPPAVLPLPAAAELRAEYAKAAEQAGAWRSLSPAQARLQVQALKGRATTPSETRIAKWVSIWSRIDGIHQDAALGLDGLRTAIALEDFREATGAYPEALSDLCPKYLAAVPADPALPGHAFGYKRGDFTIDGLALRYVLYSRGADGKDDGGSASGPPYLNLTSEFGGKDIVLNALR